MPIERYHARVEDALNALKNTPVGTDELAIKRHEKHVQIQLEQMRECVMPAEEKYQALSQKPEKNAAEKEQMQIHEAAVKKTLQLMEMLAKSENARFLETPKKRTK